MVGDGSVKSQTFQRSSDSIKSRATTLVLGQGRASGEGTGGLLSPR